MWELQPLANLMAPTAWRGITLPYLVCILAPYISKLKLEYMGEHSVITNISEIEHFLANQSQAAREKRENKIRSCIVVF
jgi:hypothetical protein